MHQDVARNIVSLCQSQEPFDDLADDPAEWDLARSVEASVKPSAYRSHVPIVHRPYEDAEWFNAIRWPFNNRWQASRFSDGSYGVWYGSESIETTVCETAYHWHHNLLSDAGFDRESVIAERRVYLVGCSAALLDFRRATREHKDLLHPTDYALAQSVGERLQREGHPGLLIQSVRRRGGENVAIFNPDVLSNPRQICSLTYHLEGKQIRVERQPGRTWMTLKV